jgi:hypothetical protein
MSDYDDYEDDDQNESGGVQQLRKQFKVLQKQLDEVTKEKETLASSVRATAITGVIAERGLNPKIAEIVPSTVTIDGLAEWFTNYGDVFGATPPAQPDAGSPSGVPVAAPVAGQTFYTDGDKAALEAMNAAQSGGFATDGVGALASSIEGAKDAAELTQILRNLK